MSDDEIVRHRALRTSRLAPHLLLRALRAELEHIARVATEPDAYERALCGAIQAVCRRYDLV